MFVVVFGTVVVTKQWNRKKSCSETLTSEDILDLPELKVEKLQLFFNGYSIKEEKFDFIVVGAGSAGCPITNRLSANGTYRVLLLEAGGEPTLITEIPAMTPLVYSTSNTWHYEAERQEGLGASLIHNKVSWTAGRGLGGSTLPNYMMHVRGHRADYDKWAADGNPGWSYDEVLPYFKKSENVHLPEYDPEYRSVGGEVDVGWNPYRFPFVDEYIKAYRSLGLGYTRDYNNGKPFGVSYLQSTLRNGSRCHAAKAFLDPIRKRKNLTIRKNSFVTKVIIDFKTKTALGVEYDHFFQKHRAYAEREVILSAGAHRSPQILMLSGIGPKNHLEEFDIDVIQDLPVGNTLYDHSTFMGLFFSLNVSGLTASTLDMLSPRNIANYFLKREGPYTTPAMVTDSVGFLYTNVTRKKSDAPDIELIQASGSANVDQGLFFRREFGMNAATYQKLYGPYRFKPTWSVHPMLFHPKSKGRLRLRSSNAHDQPKIYANYFTDPEGVDMKTFIAAIRTVQKISNTPILQKYGSTQVMTALPGCEGLLVDSDEFWACQLRSAISSIFHPIATNRMGPKNDPEAVVDNELKVYGIDNLRVADASIIPRPLAAHTSIPVMMIGEKAAELIIATHQQRS